jgi:UPF0042 nucleotide-binding protein
MTVHELRRQVQTRFGAESTQAMAVTFLSFGFKYGVPSNADLVFDVRFLPNPYYVPELKPLTGRDAPVAKYVLDRPETKEFLSRITSLLEFLMPSYQREGKAYLTVAIGCTGGKHRSVTLGHELLRAFEKNAHVVAQAFDRDVDKE